MCKKLANLIYLFLIIKSFLKKTFAFFTKVNMGYPRMVRVRGLPKITWGKELTCPFFVPNFLGFRIIL